MPLVVAMLRANQPNVQQSAPNVLGRMAQQGYQDAFIAAGAMPSLVAMLRVETAQCAKKGSKCFGMVCVLG